MRANTYQSVHDDFQPLCLSSNLDWWFGPLCIGPGGFRGPCFCWNVLLPECLKVEPFLTSSLSVLGFIPTGFTDLDGFHGEMRHCSVLFKMGTLL